MKSSSKEKNRIKKTDVFLRIIEILIVIVPISIYSIINYLFFDNKTDNNSTFMFAMITLLVSLLIDVITHIKYSINISSKNNYDQVRETYENKINDLQMKLSKSESQWQNAYHLILSSQNKTLANNDESIQNLVFLREFGLKKEDYIIDEKLVFYLTSYSQIYESTYITCKDVCKNMSLTLLRGDEIETTGDILSQTIRYIVKASLIIANIDGKNPNVFYELGIAHTLGKKVMLISKRDSDSPFDIRQNRTLFFSNDSELKVLLPESIKKFKNNYLISNANTNITSNNDNKSISNSNDIDLLISLAQVYINSKKYNEAILYCKKILDIDPNNTQALINLGKIYTELGDNEKALVYLKHVIRINSFQ